MIYNSHTGLRSKNNVCIITWLKCATKVAIELRINSAFPDLEKGNRAK